MFLIENGSKYKNWNVAGVIDGEGSGTMKTEWLDLDTRARVSCCGALSVHEPRREFSLGRDKKNKKSNNINNNNSNNNKHRAHHLTAR